MIKREWRSMPLPGFLPNYGKKHKFKLIKNKDVESTRSG